MRALIAIVILIGLAAPARAAVVASSETGFEVREDVQIAAPPAKVYAAIGAIGRWWSSEHTYSHDARNLTLDLVGGGCQCERLSGGGSARHMTVILAVPGQLVRLEGALGPLATTGGTGHLTYALTPKDGGTALSVTYVFGGYASDGLAHWAGPVDGVLGVQIARLRRYVETGKPD
ncbi:MAG TPA: SRPBCC family protein [Caulobacteraceae bacterium]|jgi:uncharacterized protein YndB with AHSA1/START domain|nr:SRPBCC family protein [Caulobacteraceae bacterium]